VVRTRPSVVYDYVILNIIEIAYKAMGARGSIVG
jgi:hypothetical protein